MRLRCVLAICVLAGCTRRAESTSDAGRAGADAMLIGPPAAVAPFTLLAKSSDGAAWAYRRAPHGPIHLVHTHGFERYASVDVSEELASSRGLPTARFCGDGRFGILTRDESGTVAARLWDPKVGRAARLDVPLPLVGWADTCELVALHGAHALPTGRVMYRETIAIVGGVEGDQTFTEDRERGGDVNVVEATKEALLLSLGNGSLRLIDRKTKSSVIFSLQPDSAWAHFEPSAFIVVPSISEGPYVVTPEANPALDKAFARTFARLPDASRTPIATALDLTTKTLSIFDGANVGRWSLAPRRLIGTQKVDAPALRWSTKVVSEDGGAMAFSTQDRQRVVVIDLASGVVRDLLTNGTPLAFVDGHEKLVVDGAIWSLTERRPIGRVSD